MRCLANSAGPLGLIRWLYRNRWNEEQNGWIRGSSCASVQERVGALSETRINLVSRLSERPETIGKWRAQGDDFRTFLNDFAVCWVQSKLLALD